MPHEPLPASPEPDGFDYEAALAACAQGEHAALQRLYRQEAPRLLGVALRIVRDRAHAEDVVHDAFLRIWQGAAGFDGARGSGRGWIYSIVRHRALNHVRDGARTVTMDEDMAAAVDDAAALAAYRQAPDALAQQADMGRLDRCLEALPPARRDCILYAYLDGCSHGEIAARLRTPLGTVKAWIQRGMASLRECMA